jgi:hypothetical protein
LGLTFAQANQTLKKMPRRAPIALLAAGHRCLRRRQSAEPGFSFAINNSTAFTNEIVAVSAEREKINVADGFFSAFFPFQA